MKENNPTTLEKIEVLTHLMATRLSPDLQATVEAQLKVLVENLND